MTLKVGIISANWGAIAHLPAWRALDGVEVTGMCTSRRETAEKAADAHGIERPFWDFREMCADPDLDIIDCGTRPVLRRDMVLAALAGGKHVYNGIPFAASLEDARATRDAHAGSGKVGIVDALSQWVPAHRRMREMLEEGCLGQPFGGLCRFNMPIFNPPVPGFPWNWFSEGGQGVSAVRNLGSHMLHMLYFLFGPMAELVADNRIAQEEWRFPDGETLTPENPDFANALLRFENDMVMQFQICWTAALGDGFMIDVFGSKGRLTSTAPSFPTPQETVLRAGVAGGAMEPVDIPDRFKSARGVAIDWTFPVPPAYPMACAMRSMVDEIEGSADARPAPDFDQAWQVERVQEAIRQSAAQGRWVKLADIDR